MPHVLAWLSAYGVRLIPYWPYRFERPDADVPNIRVVRLMNDGDYGAEIDPANPIRVEGLLDVRSEPSPDGSRVQTSTFSVPWPDGFLVSSPSDPTDGVPYYLIPWGTARTLVFTAQAPWDRAEITARSS